MQAADYALNEVYGQPYVWANAIDCWRSFSSFPQLVNNFNQVSDGSVKKGDFVIFNEKVGSVYGHIDLAMQDGSTASYQGADSNWGGNKTLHLVQHTNASYIIGSLRPKGATIVDNDIITNDDLDILRIIYACIQDGARFDATINQHANDAFLQKNLTGSLKKAIRNMFANSQSQANWTKIQKALANPGDVVPYSGPQLYVKK